MQQNNNNTTKIIKYGKVQSDIKMRLICRGRKSLLVIKFSQKVYASQLPLIYTFCDTWLANGRIWSDVAAALAILRSVPNPPATGASAELSAANSLAIGRHRQRRQHQSAAWWSPRRPAKRQRVSPPAFVSAKRPLRKTRWRMQRGIWSDH